MRIVAGRLRGRRLKAPSGRGTRPTGERVREALFSLLGPGAVVDAAVADLFAGTGALGLEALSRGASHVDFYECGRSASATLRANIASLDATARARVVGTPLPRGLCAGSAYDLVLIDPPWRKALALPAVQRLLALERLAPAGLVVVEEARGAHPEAATWEAHGLTVVDQRAWGDTAVQLLERA